MIRLGPHISHIIFVMFEPHLKKWLQGITISIRMLVEPWSWCENRCILNSLHATVTLIIDPYVYCNIKIFFFSRNVTHHMADKIKFWKHVFILSCENEGKTTCFITVVVNCFHGEAWACGHCQQVGWTFWCYQCVNFHFNPNVSACAESCHILIRYDQCIVSLESKIISIFSF